MIKSNRGQLSIFMGITLILVMGMLAFIINVGLFVKAKINLQNAVDAAAFSGAATQARQLTNISYVNWEMRNTFKEWMFKYYVLGQVGLMTKPEYGLSPTGLSKDHVSFLLRTIPSAGDPNSVGSDNYNLPSICIHNSSSTNICPIYSLPGIPRFPAIGVVGISEQHEAFVNKLVESKGANCSQRTQMNFLGALSWAYSSGIKEMPGAPLIATNRAGAWPESLELGMRIRNLEMIVNRPPVEDIDLNKVNGMAGVGADIGYNERPVKAFMSAFRNLGGGKYKDNINGQPNDELSASFKLTELSPQPFEAVPQSVSGFLIPAFTYPGETGISAYNKHYLDLQVVPVNYATLFSTFATTSNDYEPNVPMEASCAVSKSALPVPGYLMGFVKNPAVITYYAVKGEAEFTGLFFPMTSEGQARSFKLTAYAAAKPFGGRIGPKLFGFINGTSSFTSVNARADDNGKSSSYLGGLELPVIPTLPGGGSKFVPGMPIPTNNFWISRPNDIFGGVPEVNNDIKYGIPNMIYDFENDTELGALNSGGIRQIEIIQKQGQANPPSTSESSGLYNSYQMRQLKKAMGGDFAGKDMTSDDLMRALVTARQVTKYDAVNFLIPDFNRGETTNAAAILKRLPEKVPGGVGDYYRIFAPLLGEDLLYKNSREVGTIVISYMSANDKAVTSYLTSLLDVANGIFHLQSGVNTTTNINARAAKSIHINAGETPPNARPKDLVGGGDKMDSTAPSCAQDMASKFNHFFRGKNTQCGVVPLEELMIEYIERKKQNGGNLYYTATYLNKLPTRQIMTAYYPGVRQGTVLDNDATALGPIGTTSATSSYSTHRNFYSTKFIPLSKVLSTSNDYREDVFLESNVKSPDDIRNVEVQNLIKADSTTGLGGSYFLDF